MQPNTPTPTKQGITSLPLFDAIRSAVPNLVPTDTGIIASTAAAKAKQEAAINPKITTVFNAVKTAPAVIGNVFDAMSRVAGGVASRYGIFSTQKDKARPFQPVAGATNVFSALQNEPRLSEVVQKGIEKTPLGIVPGVAPVAGFLSEFILPPWGGAGAKGEQLLYKSLAKESTIDGTKALLMNSVKDITEQEAKMLAEKIVPITSEAAVKDELAKFAQTKVPELQATKTTAEGIKAPEIASGAQKIGTESLPPEVATSLREAKGLSVQDIIAKHPDIQLKRDIPATDVHGNKVVIPEGEALTPYELKGNKVLLQDGQTYIVSKNQYANIKGNAMSAEAKPFAPELAQTQEIIKGKKDVADLEKQWELKASEVNNAIKDFGATDKRTMALRYERDVLKDKINAATDIGTTKYSQYQLPNGKNYKEILIKAPIEKANVPAIDWMQSANGDLNANVFGKDLTITKEGSKFYVYEKGGLLGTTANTIEDAKKIALDYANKNIPKIPTFKSSHWDEPNVISHIRMNERTYKGKKVAFMEELQSDWAREGRSKGFATEITKDTAKQQGFSVYKAKSSTGGEAYFIDNPTDQFFYRKGFTHTGFDTEAEAWDSITKKLKETSGAVPNNPLLKNWQELSIKRALKEAVDSKAEYFSWTNGEQQAARYNLSKQVEKIEWATDSAGKQVTLNPMGGKKILFYIDKNGIVLNEGSGFQSDWVGKPISEVIGKGIGEKINAETSGKLSGEGLNIGGEWAKNLYDKQVGNIVHDLTGAKVENLDMGLLIEKNQINWRLKTDYGSTSLTSEKLKVGDTIFKDARAEIGKEGYIITDVLGDGKFKAVPKSALKNGEDPRLVASNFAETFSISNQKTTQQGIKLTPEIVAKIQGEAPQIKASGKAPFVEGKTISPESVAAGTKAAEEKFAKQQEVIVTGNKLTETMKTNQKPTFIQQIRETLNPFKYQDAPVQQAWRKQVAGDAIANEKANVEFQKLADIPRDVNSIIDYQAGKAAPEYATRVQKVFDDLFNEANARGLETGYIEHYLPQVYANPKEEVINAVIKFMKSKDVPDRVIKEYIDGVTLPEKYSTSLRMNPTFVQERAFPDYATAMAHGLTPKYDNPAQLAAYYRSQLEKTLKNREFVDSLKENHDLVPNKIPGYKAVEVPFTYEELYAKPRLAKALNEYFRDENNLGIGAKIAKFGAMASRRMQELVLSGGVPNTNINFFTIGQGIKNLTAGEGKVIGNLIYSNFDSATKGWFRANQGYISMMAEEGIDMSRRTGNWNNVYDQLSSKTGLSKYLEIAGDKFDKAFNTKTFQSYMPMQSTSIFKSTFDKAIENGMSAIEARGLAARTTRAWEGIIEDWGRGKTTADVINSLFFAPRFREGLINLYGNTVKSLTTEITNPAFAKNRKFILGSAITFAAYNALNKQLNGNYMWDNEAGKEFDLKIPIGNGKFTYIAFLPSVLAFPRNMISGGIALYHFDVELAGQKFGSVFSMPIKLISEVASNKDYFGRPIWNVDDTRIDKLRAIAKYIGVDQYNHPYVQAIYNAIFTPKDKQKDWYEVVSKMSELPFKFNSQKNIDQGKFYDAMDAQTTARNKAKEPVKKIYDELQTMKAEGKKIEADKIYYALSKDQKTLYNDIKQSEKTKTTKSLEMKLYPLYLQLQDMKKNGKSDEANAIYFKLTDEEKRIYKLIKAKFKSYE